MKAANPSNAAFGQRGRPVGTPAAPPVRAQEKTRGNGFALRLAGLAGIPFVIAFAILWTLPHIEALNGETAQAQQKIVAIVNQPITHLARSGAVSVFSPGWFHEGAIKPDFNTVDIRSTQELSYQGNVTSDIDPNEMFVGSELEFNAMTKYFYTDRSLPKKRLSEREMVEINGLYRVLGHNERSVMIQWLMLGGLFVFAILGLALPLVGRQPAKP
ncbi:hypothetical protein ACVDG8_004805 [Mesorhizobium sp. ORM8.1]